MYYHTHNNQRSIQSAKLKTPAHRATKSKKLGKTFLSSEVETGVPTSAKSIELVKLLRTVIGLKEPFPQGWNFRCIILNIRYTYTLQKRKECCDTYYIRFYRVEENKN